MPIQRTEVLPPELFEGLVSDATETRMLEVLPPITATKGDNVTITFTINCTEPFILEHMYFIYDMRRPKKSHFWRKP